MSAEARRLAASPFARFLLAGAVAALANLASRPLFGLALPYAWSLVPAYLVGMTVAWALSRRYVFGAAGDGAGREYARFGLVNLLGLAQVWVVSVGLRDHLFPAVGFAFHPDLAAHAAGVAVPAVTSYLGHKHFSFARRLSPAPAAAPPPPPRDAPPRP